MRLSGIRNYNFQPQFNGYREAILTVANPKGVHTKPASLVVMAVKKGLKEANNKDVFISLSKTSDNKEIDISSILGILMEAIPKGTELKLKASESFPEIHFNKIQKYLTEIEE